MLIPAPDFFGPDLGVASIRWDFDDPSSSMVSPYTGKRTTVADPWKSIAKAQVQLCPIADAAGIRKMRSFLRRCRGQVAVFRLPAEASTQTADETVKVGVNAAAGDRVLEITNYTTPLLDGQFLTVNGQLLQCVADQDGDEVTFEGKLREAAPAGTPVITARPFAIVFLAGSSVGWTLDAPAVHGITLNVQEAVRESDGLGLNAFDTAYVRFDQNSLTWDEL